MQRPGRKCFAGFLAVALGYLVLSGIGVHFTKGTSEIEASENRQWVASGKFWLDRQMCNWIGICGFFHYINKSGWTWTTISDDIPKPIRDHSEYWTSGSADPESWSKAEKQSREIPQYVFDHAPYVHLFSGESFWPCDLGEHLVHTTPRINYTVIKEMETDRNLTNLNELNDYNGGMSGRYIYLQSDDNVEERPRWLGGSKNIPSAPEFLQDFPSDSPPLPSLDDLADFDLEELQQQALLDYAATQTDYPYPPVPTNRSPSSNGRCGSNTGFTCTGSAYGQCCSIYGYCGSSSDYCGADCDPLAGTCPDPLNPPRGPHRELRKRRLNNPTSNPNLAGRPPHPSAGKSNAPALLIVVDKGAGILDAFWFFFYSYNLGNLVFNIRFGNHVGDWEHTCIRFHNSTPSQIFLSEHNFGQAYAWHAVEKYLPHSTAEGKGLRMLSSRSNSTAASRAKRPVLYSAEGSHAMYALPGLHPYVLPWGLLHDQTDRGPLWDPALNSVSYTYSPSSQTLKASTRNPKAPEGWFHYAGHWGDKFYPLGDPRQYRFAGQYHYVNGPSGPKFKRLGREEICQRKGKCEVRNWLGGRRPRFDTFPSEQEGMEEGGLPGGNSTEGA